jgi:hypothetical protein
MYILLNLVKSFIIIIISHMLREKHFLLKYLFPLLFLGICVCDCFIPAHGHHSQVEVKAKRSQLDRGRMGKIVPILNMCRYSWGCLCWFYRWCLILNVWKAETKRTKTLRNNNSQKIRAPVGHQNKKQAP